LGSLPLAATAAALLLLIAITLTLAATIAALTLTLVATALAAWGTPLTAVACFRCQHIMNLGDMTINHDRTLG
jgi:FlaG/FlaF family flagellin (archaellin)